MALPGGEIATLCPNWSPAAASAPCNLNCWAQVEPKPEKMYADPELLPASSLLRAPMIAFSPSAVEQIPTEKPNSSFEAASDAVSLALCDQVLESSL